MLCAGLGVAVISRVAMFTSDSKDLQIPRMNLYQRHMTFRTRGCCKPFATTTFPPALRK
jgi:hypothetical protein